MSKVQLIIPIAFMLLPAFFIGWFLIFIRKDNDKYSRRIKIILIAGEFAFLYFIYLILTGKFFYYDI